MKSEPNLKQTVATFLRQYTNPVTQEAYRQTLNPLIEELGGHRLLSSITILDMLDWSARIRSTQRGLAEATIYKHIKHVKAFFNWLHRVELIPTNPAKAIKQVRVTNTRASQQRITRDQIEELRDSLADDPRALALVLFLADTGCRRGGAAGLRVRDLHLRSRTAEVVEKDKTRRTVFFGRACALALSRWLRSRRSTSLDDFVFSRDGRPITAAAVAQLFRRRTIAAGLGSMGPHRLRRHKITALLADRVSPKTVQDLVGHQRIETTLSYVPKDMAAVKEVADEYAIEEKPVKRSGR